jgi:hypothetical protein
VGTAPSGSPTFGNRESLPEPGVETSQNRDMMSPMRLASYLKSRGKKPSEFAKENKIPVMTVCRVIDGEWISLRSAERIVRATGGKVRLEDLVPLKDGAAA